MNIILTIFLLPFIPVFFLGHIAPAFNAGSVLKFDKSEIVLGENSEKDKKAGSEESRTSSLERCNLFPIDTGDAQYLPVRKKNFHDLKLWAASSVVIDVDSGTILHYDNGRKRTQVASLTKIMTAILAVENIKDLNEEVVVTPEALNVPGTVVGCPTSTFCNGNRMYRGEKVRATDLLKVMLLNSANDAATALGIHIAGTPEAFSEMMNEKAKSLGLKDTHFCTPSGLEIDGQESECYSSAYDITRIAAYSLRYGLIWDIMKMQEGEFTSTDGKYKHDMKNTDLLLEEIPNCLGGKTGFTPMAGKSLLLGSVDATKQHKVIAVVLNDENRWEDMRILVNWIFDNYEWR